ncbi:ATP-binding protein [Bifidobacterium subtile]|jgi:hypothetical protein|uniref:ATP-binding protein n=1 Tax=Bifidobacterium subtile TaxID=77635 RepID=UPI002F350544
MIDDYYSKSDTPISTNSLDKKNFYIGMISQVSERNITIQIDNLSLLTHRILRQTDLIPNTINYYVVVDSISGIYFGQVIQNDVPKGLSRTQMLDEKNIGLIGVEATIDILGFEEFGTKKFYLTGFSRPGIAEKVYLADREVVNHFIDSIEIQSKESQKNEGTPVQTISFAHLSNIKDTELKLHPDTLFNRHLLTVGATNSGKSTSALSILDQLIRHQTKILLIDPTGEYRESFDKKEMKHLTLGINTTVPVGELTMQHWSMLFDCNENTQEAVLSEAIRSLRYQKKNELKGILKKEGNPYKDIQDKLATVTTNDTDFEINDLISQISAEAVDLGNNRNQREIYVPSTFRFNTYQWLTQKISNQFDNTSIIRFFSSNSTKPSANLIDELNLFASTPNTSLYVDASEIGTTDGVGGMVVDLITNYLLNLHDTQNNPFVIFVDEVHRYAKRFDSSQRYYSGLTSVAREGRKKGIFLFLTTQNPNDVAPELLGQIGTMLIHRLTHQNELSAIHNNVGDASFNQIRRLNQGEAILTSVNLLEDLHISVDRCSRQHDNATPSLSKP